LGFVFHFVCDHFIKEHLSSDQVGLLAQRAGVHALVLTHFGGRFDGKEQIARLTRIIATHCKGRIHFAGDLERF
jgi:ribonuclease BN (tRNA processing enzyme)